MATTRANLYRLIDQLPDNAVAFAEKLLQTMVTDFPAPIILERLDEPSEGQLRPEFLQSLDESEKDIATGHVQSWADVKKELGL